MRLVKCHSVLHGLGWRSRAVGRHSGHLVMGRRPQIVEYRRHDLGTKAARVLVRPVLGDSEAAAIAMPVTNPYAVATMLSANTADWAKAEESP